MNATMLEMKMIHFFQKEYKMAIEGIEKKYNKPCEVVQNAKMRMYGVATYCQDLGLSYNLIEEMYNLYKEKLENLLTN